MQHLDCLLVQISGQACHVGSMAHFYSNTGLQYAQLQPPDQHGTVRTLQPEHACMLASKVACCAAKLRSALPC